MEFQDKLTQLMELKNLSDQKVARKVGVSRPTVGSWRKGLTQPKAHQVEALAKLFEVDAGYLVNDKTEEPLLVSRPEIEMLVLGIIERIGYEEAFGRLTSASGSATKDESGNGLHREKTAILDDTERRPKGVG